MPLCAINIFCLLFSNPGFSQVSGQIEPSSQKGQLEEAVALESVVVTAERITPAEGAAVSVISAEEYSEYQPKDVGEALKMSVAGATGKRIGGMHLEPVVRGLSKDRLSVMTNGTKIWGGGPFRMDPPTSLLDIDELESIEIIKGPYSVTRGPSSIGGTINLVTKQPELSANWYARGSVGASYASNHDGWATRATVSAGGPSLAFRLSGSYRDYQDYDSGDGERVLSGFQSQSISGGLLWQPDAKHRIRVSMSRESDRDARFGTLPLSLEEDDAYLGSVSYTITDPMESVESLEFSAYYNYVHHRMNNEHKPTRGMMRVVFPLDARTFGGRLQANVPSFFGGRLTVGGDIYRLEREGTNHVSFLKGPKAGMHMFFDSWPDAHVLDGGLFGEYAYQIFPRFRLVVGTRVDFVDTGANPDEKARMGFNRFYGPGASDFSEFQVNVSANGRLIYTLSSAAEVFVGVGRAVRTADTTERYFALGPGPGGFFVGNPQVDQEESLEVDVGFSGLWGRMGVSGAVFYNRFDDYILEYLLTRADVNMDGKTDNVRGFRNIDYASLMGFDFDLSYALREDLMLHGSFAYVRGENEEQDRALAEIPPLEGIFGLRYEYAHWDAWINPMLRLVQSQHRVDTFFGEDTTQGHVTVDVSAGFQMLDKYEFKIFVSNLFDKNYSDHLTRENPFSGRDVFEPGRVVTMGFRTTF